MLLAVEFSILPDIDYFEEPKDAGAKQEIMRSTLPTVAQSEIFKKTPILRCQTPLIPPEERAIILKSISDHIKGDNQFCAIISAHDNVPAAVIRQLDDFIQIRIDTPSLGVPAIQLFAKSLEVCIGQNSRLVIELEGEVSDSRSYWTEKEGCVIVILTKEQPELWRQIM